MPSVACRWNGRVVAVLIHVPLFELLAGASPSDQVRVYLLKLPPNSDFIGLLGQAGRLQIQVVKMMKGL